MKLFWIVCASTQLLAGYEWENGHVLKFGRAGVASSRAFLSGWLPVRRRNVDITLRIYIYIYIRLITAFLAAN